MQDKPKLLPRIVVHTIKGDDSQDELINTQKQESRMAYIQVWEIFVQELLQRNTLKKKGPLKVSKCDLLQSIQTMSIETADKPNLQILPWWIIHPEGKLRGIWSVVILLTIVYTATITPYSVAFLRDQQMNEWVLVDLIVNLAFVTDILINFFTAFYDIDGTLIRELKKIWSKYLSTWFFLDLLASMPFPLLEDQNQVNYATFGRFLRLFRIYRVIHQKNVIYQKAYYKLQEWLDIKFGMLWMIGFFTGLLVLVHIISCFWYLMPAIDQQGPDTWTVREGYQDQENGIKYLGSVYWTITTLTTIGFGDLKPYTLPEKLFGIFWMFVGLYFLSVTIGSVSLMIGQSNIKQNSLSFKLSLIEQFAQQHHLSKDIKKKLRKALFYNTEKSGIQLADKLKIFNELPKDLKYEMAVNMHHGKLKGITFFKDKNRSFISDIVPFFQPMFVTRNDIVYSQGEGSDQIYFVVFGQCSYWKDFLLLAIIGRGGYFGDIEIFDRTSRKYTARAKQDTELLVMNKTLINIIKERYYDVYEDMQEEALQRDEANITVVVKNEFFQQLIEEKKEEEYYSFAFQNRVKNEVKKRRRKADRGSKISKWSKEENIGKRDLMIGIQDITDKVQMMKRNLDQIHKEVSKLSKGIIQGDL